jgi:DNA modification methylase
MQRSKTIYFHDYQTAAGERTGLTIPFPDTQTFRYVEHLSSFRLRELLGFENYTDLESAARAAGTAIATFARNILLKKRAAAPHSDITETAVGIQSTFQGGKGSPLHDWYPYLEGYSPDFVRTVLRTYAPDAKTVLDPFCGSGTTALVSAGLGKHAFFSEVNPVCREIIKAKITAVSLSDKVRQSLAYKLFELSRGLRAAVEMHAPDGLLQSSFQTAFGERPFFRTEDFSHVLQMRTLIDEIRLEDPDLACFVGVAVLRSLVPSSFLVRRGDLRFRTASEKQRMPISILDEVKSSIELIASDLLDISTATGKVTSVGSDARLIKDNFTEPVDVILTSPPYLNGTNYFRNTKIELWFLRHLQSKADMRLFRDLAITSGINDVTAAKSCLKTNDDLPEAVYDVVQALQQDAYDQRIPMMVQSYFSEMQEVIRSLKSVCKEGTAVCIDLGDSCYGGVWVPTHQIIHSIMNKNGFLREAEVVLRERQSRDGRKLTQTLQVFKLASREDISTSEHSKVPKTKGAIGLPPDWSLFKSTLPHQVGAMARRNWGHPWHSLCSYQGKLKPSIASALVDALMPSATGSMLDPFSGVGTLPFEARLRNHKAFGFDISPAAVIISRAKLATVEADEARQELNLLASWIVSNPPHPDEYSAIEGIRFNGPLSLYFHPDTLAEILSARSYFRQHPPVSGSRSLVMSCLLHVLHGNRPYALSRNSHPITPFAPTGPSEYKSLVAKVSEKLERSLAALSSVKLEQGASMYQDATAPWPEQVSDLDAIITSPPFFASTRFHSANWMRLWFAGWETKDFGEQPRSFVDERQKRTFDVYEPIFQQAAERLRPWGYLAFHLGKSVKCDMAAALSVVGARYLRIVDSFSESVEHCESHGIRDKGSVTEHQYLLFQRA